MVFDIPSASHLPFAKRVSLRLVTCTFHWIILLDLPKLPLPQTNLPGKQSWSCGNPCTSSSSLNAPSARVPSLQFHISPQLGSTCLWTKYDCDSPRLVAHYLAVVPGLTSVEVRRRLATHYFGFNHGLDWTDLSTRQSGSPCPSSQSINLTKQPSPGPGQTLRNPNRFFGSRSTQFSSAAAQP